MCVCVCERERERERAHQSSRPIIYLVVVCCVDTNMRQLSGANDSKGSKEKGTWIAIGVQFKQRVHSASDHPSETGITCVMQRFSSKTWLVLS